MRIDGEISLVGTTLHLRPLPTLPAVDHPLLEFGSLVHLNLNSFCSARISRLHAQASAGAHRALNLAARPADFLAAAQIGITVIGNNSAIFAGGSRSRYPEAGLPSARGWTARSSTRWA